MAPRLVYFNNLSDRRSFAKRLLLATAGSMLFLPRLARASSTIINRTISAASQNAISMSNSTWARPIALPSTWTKIRVGITAHINNSAANLTGQATFAMGFNSGTANQYGDVSCQNFVGMAWDAATWVWNNTATTFYSTGAGGTTPVSRVRIGSTNTDSAAINGTGATYSLNAGAGTSSADRQAIFVDIFKGSPNFTFHLPFSVYDAVAGDVTAAKFLTYMGQLNPQPTETNYINFVTTPADMPDQTLAVNEGLNGTLNAINLYWNRADAPLEICNVAVAVLA